MHIDRHNYEEYFLLYIDNELNMADKKQVELFVQENPDLEEEFLMLQQSKLVADDDIMFEGKELLMKEEKTPINLSNYEEWLVQYTDNELNAEQKKEVEAFAAAHATVQEELNLFAKTKLHSETIVFPDKASLYRKEEKRRGTIITLQWWKVAVAAVLIIAAGITVYSVVNNDRKAADGAKSFAKSTRNDQSKKSSLNGNNSSADQKDSRPDLAKTKDEQVQGTREIQKGQEAEQAESIDEKNIRPNAVAQLNTTREKEVKDKNNKVSASEDDRVREVFAYNNDANTPPNETTPTTTRPAITSTDVNTTKPKTNFIASAEIPKGILNTSIVTNDPSDSPNNKATFASNTENKKGGLRGFFRKATRFIERTTNINPANDDDKVLIGGMAINLK